ncbi:ead/Ea22-like family protein [Brevibacillus laterosporus]|uniref:Ead/Ea22-like family protein n=1 Tax=Brevibacillus laterosporus TaxID=1465 RepID=A0AAP3DI95_BRELA|nr:ead/Ea22-like family protein [Brevibacillus laterosporus]MCR8981473.1 ead/Ea22-like family protein [Brevibacillus laterosporus]MCZ0808628.1 ead/Ea22-like family protein [Brevibacillus laterosporus]MCZ0827090.1 ead/Ea22-like family protein [Brevibacillus laterosporus]MCZ0850798.1 ead/Ea22-like family protein [Brevibacillus laterosporus]
MMTREEIEAIRERAEKATEGPWRAVPTKMDCFDIYDVYDKLDRSLIHREEDAEFIAHAREDIPKLLAENERLHTKWQRLREYVDDRRGKAFEDHDASEGNGSRYFYGGRSSAFTNVQDMIHALEREGDEC